jgi:uncharacterized membrane protein
MNAAQQLEYEARVRNRYALVAVIAGVLVLASSVTGLVGPQSRVSETTLALVFAHKRAALDIAGSVINLLGLLAEAATLNWLYRVSRAR